MRVYRSAEYLLPLEYFLVEVQSGIDFWSFFLSFISAEISEMIGHEIVRLKTAINGNQKPIKNDLSLIIWAPSPIL